MTAILTIAEAARRIAAKQVSPVELAKTHLDRIRRLDPQLNAFLVVTEERALADAKAAEARQMSGTLRGRLDGIPIAHGHLHTAGIATAHSRLLSNVPSRVTHQSGRTASCWALDTRVCLRRTFVDLPWPPARNPGTGTLYRRIILGTGAAVCSDPRTGLHRRLIRGPAAFAALPASQPMVCPAGESCRWLSRSIMGPMA